MHALESITKGKQGTRSAGGRFIVLDGPDGSGTTLHTKLLRERFERAGNGVLGTAEPTDGPIGALIRDNLKAGSLSGTALQLLFCADRADHCARIIEPALRTDTIVISDRYVPSTIAYGQALGLDPSWLTALNKNFIEPDLTLFLLPPIETALERLRRRSAHDALEDASLQRRVHQAYAAIAKADSSIAVIDTSGEKEAVAEQIWKRVQTIF